MRFAIAAGLVSVAALIQSLTGPSLPVVRGRPDLVMVVVLAWSMLRGSGEGAFVGFLGGVLLDSVSYTPFAGPSGPPRTACRPSFSRGPMIAAPLTAGLKFGSNSSYGLPWSDPTQWTALPLSLS